MTEQEETDTLEDLAGGPDRAFRLMRIWTSSRNNVSAHGRLFNDHPTQADGFAVSAQRDGYSKEAIQFYVEVIQGHSID